MPRFTQTQLLLYLEDFFDQLPQTKEIQTDRVRGAVTFALLDDHFREEIAEQMGDVKELIEQAEVYVEQRVAEENN